MKERGGGVVDMTFRVIEAHLIMIHLHINVCESMGANCANKVAEGIAPFIAEITGSLYFNIRYSLDFILRFKNRIKGIDQYELKQTYNSVF